VESVRTSIAAADAVTEKNAAAAEESAAAAEELSSMAVSLKDSVVKRLVRLVEKDRAGQTGSAA
jgi:methyl-accepting chemotaxis protein